MPQTLPESRDWMRSSSMAEHDDFSLPGVSFDAAAPRLHAFAEKCLRKNVSSTTAVKNDVGTSQATFNASLTPHFVKDKNRLTLYVLRKEDTLSVGWPKDGRYEFLTELSPEGGGVRVFTGKIKGVMGNVFEDLENWLKGTGRYCPEIH